ncbi:MAG: hypothetical protein HY791_33395 [Deltaproteobacteria bacterium]|nr:hypothetical protein [Deltaproteobacteria bacterium]
MFVATLTISCGSPSFVTPDLGDSLIAYAVFEGNSVRSAGLLDESAASVEVEGEYEVHTWALPREWIVDLDGRTVDASGLVVQSDDAVDGCHRCINEAASPKWLLVPGESCPPPLFATARGWDANEQPIPTSEDHRQAVRLSRRGTCACPIPEPEELPAIELTPILADAWPVGAVATSSASIAIFEEHFGVVYFGDGRSMVRRRPFRGPVEYAEATRLGHYLVATNHPTTPNVTELELYDDELERMATLESSRDLSDLAIDSTSGAMFVAPKRFNDGHDVALCTEPESPARCDWLLPAEASPLGPAKIRITGGRVLVWKESFFYALEGVPSPGELVVSTRERTGGVTLGTVSDELGGTHRWRLDEWPSIEGRRVEGFDAVVADQAVFVLGRVKSGALADTLLLSAPDELEGPREWRVVQVFGQQDRIGIAADAEGVLVGLARDSYRCTREACGPPRATSDVFSTNHRIKDLTNDGFGRVVAVSETSVFVRPKSAASFERVHGPESPYPVVAVLSRQDSFEVFTAPGQKIALEGPLVSTTEPPASLLRLIDVAYDSSRSAYLAVHAGSERTQLVRILDDRVEMLELELPLGTYRVAEVAPRRFLVASPTELLAFVDDELLSITVDWDDPQTPLVELAPETHQWLDIGAGGGGAWAVGSPALVVKVEMFAEPPKATRVSAERLDPELYNPASEDSLALSAVHVDCADVGSIGAFGRSFATNETGRLWHLRPGAGGLLDFPAASENGVAAQGTQSDSGRPLRVVGRGGSLSVVFANGSVHRVGSAGRFQLGGATITAAAQARSGELVVGTSGGLIFRSK